MDSQIKIGISSCLLGQNVRYDGGHSLDRFLSDTLGQFVEYVPVCLEVETGFSVPRETMHLTGDPENPRLVTTKTNIDHTDRMVRWAKKRLKSLEDEQLCGFIFKSKSPSSGMERVKVYNEKGMPVKKGVGIFARAFIDYFPLIPVEEDGRLHDPLLRENFIERIFSHKRWRGHLKKKKSLGSLLDFHTRHKMLVLSHSEKNYRIMGKLLAEGKKYNINKLYSAYEALLTDSLRLKTTIKKHTNVLQHMIGFFKKYLSKEEKTGIPSYYKEIS